jgi:hypothetical protein
MVTWSWIMSGFGITILILILLLASGVVIETNHIAAFIAFTCAAVFIGINNMVTRPQPSD